MRRIYLILLIVITTNVYSQDCLDMDIILLGDYSGSVGSNAKYIKQAFHSFATSFKESASVRIGIVLFSDFQFTICTLTDSRSDTVIDSILLMNNFSWAGGTNIAEALEFSYMMLYNDQQSMNQTIILVSDGDDVSSQVIPIADNIKANGVIIASVYVPTVRTTTIEIKAEYTLRWEQELMKEISSGKEYNTESNYKNLSNNLKTLGICM